MCALDCLAYNSSFSYDNAVEKIIFFFLLFEKARIT